MNAIPKPAGDSVASSIAAVRQAWLDAIRAGDVDRFAALVTDDIVVVHGTGRCVRGEDELRTDLRTAFKTFSIEQSTAPARLVVRGRWALEIVDVETKLTRYPSGERTVFQSMAVTALKRQPDGSWKIGRVLGVLDTPPPSLK